MAPFIVTVVCSCIAKWREHLSVSKPLLQPYLCPWNMCPLEVLLPPRADKSSALSSPPMVPCTHKVPDYRQLLIAGHQDTAGRFP